MVIKGKGSYTKQPPKLQPKSPPTNLIGEIAVLSRQKNKEQAQDLLHTIARMTAPIMNLYNFKVKKLREFLPKDARLLGTNWGKGHTISIRLRPAFDTNGFYPLEELIGTMLHELTHNKFGAHDQRFYGLLDELKAKFEEMQIGGCYGVTGYISEQNKLGGSRLNAGGVGNVNTREARLKKLGQVKYVSKVAKLGTNLGTGVGGVNLKGKSVRELVLAAVERRMKDCKTCPSERSDKEIVEILPDDDELDVIPLGELDWRVGDDQKSKNGNEEKNGSVRINKEDISKSNKRKIEEVLITDDDDDDEIIGTDNKSSRTDDKTKTNKKNTNKKKKLFIPDPKDVIVID
ncbi:unnamed protein product [Ambrosiozyma monospora]|uniref:Unnamed protein product n=1 Tax=Ambrosiozyma monospora TaxID=43982 RepID=A0A9W7DHQ5_AMBMO|nr:unnamed protein product [Ambrosiozyma monospora]